MRNTNYYFICVGGGELKDEIQKSADDFGIGDHFVITGIRDDIGKLLSAMDIFLFPSYREGFGNVVIEAEAMGVPVIVSDIPGPQNGMVDNVTGFKVPPREWKPLFEKTCELIEDKEKREAFGAAGAKFSPEHFDSKVLITKIIENRDWLISRG